MPSESKPWQSVFTQCLLLLKVSASPCLLFSTSVALLYLLTFFSSFSLLSAFYRARFTRVSPSSLQPNDDPLMTAVNLLEEDWISIQETFELVNRVLSRLFVSSEGQLE
jgi:hypothetical protein